MKRILTIIICFLFVSGGLFGCGASAEYEKNRIKTNAEKTSVSDTALAGGLDGYLSFSAEFLKNSGDGNSLVSPASLLLALGMTFNGAEGETLLEAEKVFGMSISVLNEFCLALGEDIKNYNSKSETRIKEANSLWIEEEYGEFVKDEYMSEVGKYYDPEVFSLPFDSAAVKKINDWTSDRTDGEIKKLVDNLNDVRVALVNALIVKGRWQTPANNSFDREFTSYDGRKSTCKFFSGYGALDESESAYAVKKYLAGGAFYLCILPKEAAYFADYSASFGGEELKTLLTNNNKRGAEYIMPEFNGEFSYDLIPILSSMGIERAFTKDADFSKMTSNPRGLRIGDALQKTRIRVTKTGLTAAAATVIATKDATDEMPIEKPLKLSFDRPFLYVICMPNGEPLFIGKQVSM